MRRFDAPIPGVHYDSSRHIGASQATNSSPLRRQKPQVSGVEAPTASVSCWELTKLAVGLKLAWLRAGTQGAVKALWRSA